MVKLRGLPGSRKSLSPIQRLLRASMGILGCRSRHPRVCSRYDTLAPPRGYIRPPLTRAGGPIPKSFLV
jgi:hypothetical protein